MRRRTERDSQITLLAGFVVGFMFRHAMGLFGASKINNCSNASPQHHNSTTTISEGIYPLMRDFHCGHANMQTPRVLHKQETPQRRYVVDIGLDDGTETLDAVENGFIVFGFELLTESISKIRNNAIERGIIDQLHFVEFKENGKGIPEAKSLPPPPDKVTEGFAYIYNAGISDEIGSISSTEQSNAVASIKGKTISKTWTKGRVPILSLDQALPSWVNKIFFLKIDTQGYELKVLNGAMTYLQSSSVQYAQYEFSPKLMRTSQTGDPKQLLQLMISMGAVCFDMMMGDVHHYITRPSTPLETYYNSLNSGMYSPHPSAKNKYATDDIGPWDDIVCWFPEATR